MTGLMRLSTRLYGGILTLYPPDLRQEFGPEMSELFSEDLNDAWRSRGLAGVIGIWWCALCEIFRVALPAQWSNPAFTVPVIATLNVLTICGELIVMRDPIPMEALVAALLWPSVLTALTAIAVVHTGKVHVVSLDLKCSKSAN